MTNEEATQILVDVVTQKKPHNRDEIKEAVALLDKSDRGPFWTPPIPPPPPVEDEEEVQAAVAANAE